MTFGRPAGKTKQGRDRRRRGPTATTSPLHRPNSTSRLGAAVWRRQPQNLPRRLHRIVNFMAFPKPRRDWLYLAVVGTQLLGMLAMDLVPFYPESLWLPPSAPLHPLVSLRALYLSHSGDPYIGAPLDAHEPWFRFFIYVEGLVQLPLAAYLVYQLASLRRTRGPAELAALAFGCITAMNASVCCFDLWHMGPARLSPRHKATLFYGTYLPFAVVPAVMAVDMYMRLLPRVRGDSKTVAKKKRT